MYVYIKDLGIIRIKWLRILQVKATETQDKWAWAVKEICPQGTVEESGGKGLIHMVPGLGLISCDSLSSSSSIPCFVLDWVFSFSEC